MPLALSITFASSGVSLANCGLVYFFFRPNFESGVGLLGPGTSSCIVVPLFRTITLLDGSQTSAMLLFGFQNKPAKEIFGCRIC